MTNLAIAIPDSSLIESQTILDKSYKISQISRSCSIFRVNSIIIYHDRSVKAEKIDKKILKTILEYLDTPPYLRKRIYPKMWILKHTGILPPIKSPHHKALIDIKDITDNEIRFGIVVKKDDSLYVDVGLGETIRYNGTQIGKKVLVKISTKGTLFAEDISKDEIDGYWGYDVQFADSLSTLIENTKYQVLMTSIEGAQFAKHAADFMSRAKISKNLLIVFGGPKFGLRRILESESKRIPEKDYFFNMFPKQGTQTVRLEEAIIGTLSIVNNYLHS
ncbi:MAG TPA: RNA methyltransferase [Nitrososphaeraceae archaeon]